MPMDVIYGIGNGPLQPESIIRVVRIDATGVMIMALISIQCLADSVADNRFMSSSADLLPRPEFLT